MSHTSRGRGESTPSPVPVAAQGKEVTTTGAWYSFLSKVSETKRAWFEPRAVEYCQNHVKSAGVLVSVESHTVVQEYQAGAFEVALSPAGAGGHLTQEHDPGALRCLLCCFGSKLARRGGGGSWQKLSKMEGWHTQFYREAILFPKHRPSG